MQNDLGLYVTLLPKGKIKRDITCPAGDVSPEETTVQDELILYSELNFEPYACVADIIRTSVSFLCIDNDNRFHENKVNPNVYQFILETVLDLVDTLSEENLLHGLLLRTALEDLPSDDGSSECRIFICQKIVSTLEEIMLFQFVINEVMHDLAEKKPLDEEKYEGLWQASAETIFTVEDVLTIQYYFRSATEYYHFLLLHFISVNPNVAFCQCCGRYFIPKTKSRTLYCDRIIKDGKTCKHWAPILKHKLSADREKVVETFDRVKRRMYKRYERTEFINQKPSDKSLSYDEYYVWLDKATKARDEYLMGELSAEDALQVIDVP